MTLGFSVNELLPRARGGGQLKMGLVSLKEGEWLQPNPDLAERELAFAEHPDGTQLSLECIDASDELAEMLEINGGLLGAAKAHHEDMCLLTRQPDEDVYRLVGAAVAYPTDWHPKDKLGLPLAAMHAPIQGYEEQLAIGVDHFMAKLKPGKIFGRCNWFIAPTPKLRWIANTPPEVAFRGVTSENAGGTLFIRSERQTLRRLPQTGAILFTIGVYVEPLYALNRANVSSLSDAMRGLQAGEGDRRGSPFYAEALIGYSDTH